MSTTNERRVPPAVARIVATDYWCMLLAATPAILAVLACVLVYTGRIDTAALVSRLSIAQVGDLGRDDIPLGIAVLLVVFCPPLLAKRVGWIRRIFREGMETDGEVVFFRRFRDRGRIEFEFEHNDEIVRAANPVLLTRTVRSIGVGQCVTVVYLPEKPKAALIREIYQ